MFRSGDMICFLRPRFMRSGKSTILVAPIIPCNIENELRHSEGQTNLPYIDAKEAHDDYDHQATAKQHGSHPGTDRIVENRQRVELLSCT